MNAIKDKAFKHLFTYVEIITDFLERLYSYFGIEGDLNIKYLNGEQLIPGEYINTKDFYGDIVAETKDTIISLEAYTNYMPFSEKKSFSYAARLYGSQLKTNVSYENLRKLICINLIAGNKPKKYNTMEIYEMFDIKYQKELEIKPLKYIRIYIDMVKEIPYNKDEHRFITWLRILACSDISEMRKYAEGDVIMEKTIRYLDKFYAEEGNSREDRFKSDLEDMRMIGQEEGLVKGEKIGIAKGKELGIAEGKKLGIAEGRAETAMAMLENNFSIEDIAKVTKMSINKIKALIG